jgi:NAD(P)-dependent dehydrogenase (short-subunit alcohol dehydrogenase family)
VDIRLDGKVALVTGGSYGIGFAIAVALSEAGAALLICARDPVQLAAARDEILAREPGARVETYVADVADPLQSAACVAAVVERLGSLDVLVNSASGPVSGRLMDLVAEKMEAALRSSVVATVLWTQDAWRAWMAEHGGVVVNMSSVAAGSVEYGFGFYGATKAAIERLTEQMAAELGPGVRVNAVAPGWIRTPRTEPAFGKHNDSLSASLPLRRLGTPEDVAKVVVFLASDAAAYITGQVLPVDGGRLVVPGPYSALVR